MVTCMREQLLLGNKIQLGDLGNFYVALKSRGADTFEDWSQNNIKKINVNWERGVEFENLLDDATFQEVLSRKQQAEELSEKKNA